MKRRTKNILVWIPAVLLAIAYIFVGLPKIMSGARQIMYIKSWGLPVWTRFPIGITEMLFAAGILIPRFQKPTIFGVFIWAAVAEFTLIHAKPPQYEAIVGPVLYVILAVIMLWLLKPWTRSYPVD